MLKPFNNALITAADFATLSLRYAAIRNTSVDLAAPLSAEDCAAQSMPDCSPVKWHLAHTSWFFETFILEKFELDFKPYHHSFRVLFNSYYNGIGEKYSRPHRGLLTRPSLDEVLAYRGNIDARITDLLTQDFPAMEADELATLVELGLQHEQQHQELILTDVKHLLSQNPLFPAYNSPAYNSKVSVNAGAKPVQNWVEFPAGVIEIGHAGETFYFDNEIPRHRQFVEAYALSSRLVTNAEYAAFIADGGYRSPAFWLSDGWEWINANNIAQPLYWQRDESGRWLEFSLHGLHEMAADAPALHLSFYEAAAFANWAGARLPTEAEWENATGNAALTQMLGAAWQWTSSSYAPYPGFTAQNGAIGEYNGKFMVNQYVLRGSSCATPEGHSRPTYRNFFPAAARWQFTGIRLAR